MAALNYYLGLKRGDTLNQGTIQAGVATVGSAADVELRIQINDGVTATGITRLDVLRLIDILENYVESGGLNAAGTYLPAL